MADSGQSTGFSLKPNDLVMAPDGSTYYRPTGETLNQLAQRLGMPASSSYDWEGMSIDSPNDPMAFMQNVPGYRDEYQRALGASGYKSNDGFGSFLKEAAVAGAPFALSLAMPGIGSAIASELGVSTAVGNAIAKAATGIAMGKDPMSAIAGSATGYLTNSMMPNFGVPNKVADLGELGINTDLPPNKVADLGELGINTALKPDGTMTFANNPDGTTTGTDAAGNKTTINADGSTSTSKVPNLGGLVSSLLSKAGVSPGAATAALGGAGLAALLGGRGSPESAGTTASDAQPLKFSWGEQAVKAPVNGVAYGQQFVKPTYAAEGGLMSIGLSNEPAPEFGSQEPKAPTQQPTTGFLYAGQPGNMPNYTQTYAHGGLSSLGDYTHMSGGRFLKGPGDGMSDDIPASIAGKQPARLASEEFVIPADVVSHLGNGSSEAGAKVLYGMMNKVRKARTGTTKQGKRINPEDFVPHSKA